MTMTHAFLTGSKVGLRPIERSDAPQFKAWVNDPDVTRTLLLHRPMNLQAEETFIDEATNNEHSVVLAIMAKATGKVIGATGLHPIDFQSRHSQFRIFIGDKGEWGKGYGTEATRLIVGYGFDTRGE
jgi:RimJ/RimL family protein N-acetyltransferase